MKPYIRRGSVGITALVTLFAAWGAWAQSQSPEPIPPTRSRIPEPPAESGYAGSSSELQPGQWKGGGGLGFLGSTPDGTAFAMNGNLDYFVTQNVSVGPLLQLGITDDLTQVGLSTQGKYWVDLPGTQGRGKLVLQSGIGFIHADFRADDTSWLVPLGVGYDYALNSGTSLTGTMLVNFTNLHTGAGTGADVMPGFAFGIRF